MFFSHSFLPVVIELIFFLILFINLFDLF